MFNRPPEVDEEIKFGRNRTVIDVIPRDVVPQRRGINPLNRLGMVWTIFVAFFFLMVGQFNLTAFFDTGTLEAIALIGGAPWAFLALLGWAFRG